MDSSNGRDYDSLDVAVVGAGPAGLCLARRLAGTDASFAVFERNGDVGGVWDIDAPGSPMYESAHFISSKTLSGFPGFPMPDRYPDYPNHRQILDYIRSYADRFDLRRHIQFECGVLHAALDADGSWKLGQSPLPGVCQRRDLGATHSHLAREVRRGDSALSHIPGCGRTRR